MSLSRTRDQHPKGALGVYDAAMLRLSLMALLMFLALPAKGAYIVEPAMESVIKPLMAVPKGAPKGTRSAGASLSQHSIEVRFVSPKGEAASFTLLHPSQAGPEDLKAGPFAIKSTLKKGHPLTRAFVKACLSVGERFRWSLAGSEGEISPLELARTRLVMMDVDGVKSALEEAIAKAGDDVGVLRRAAVILKAAGQDEDAKAKVERAREALGEAPEGVHERAEVLALDAVEGSLKLSSVDALVARGERGACAAIRVADSLDLLGRATDARTLAEAALSAAPRCRDAHRLICELLGREKDWPALLERSDKGIATFERHGDFQIQRATALRGLGKNDEARDILEAEVRKNPQDTGPMSSLAALYTMTRTSESGYATLAAACDKDPDDIVSCFLAGVIAHYLAKHDACVAHMNALVERLPNQPRVPMYAAISSYWMDRVADADRLIAVAANISGAMDPDVFYCRALIRMKRDKPGAIEDLERFLTVAHRGWHSQGKIGRVNHELAMLKRGEIPPPAEAHHRRQSSDAPKADAKGQGGERLSADDLLTDESGVVAGGLLPLYHTKTEWNPDQITFGFKTKEGERVSLALFRAEEPTPEGKISLGKYTGELTITTPSGDAAEALKAAVDALITRITSRAEGGPNLRQRRVSGEADASRGPPGAQGALPSAHRRQLRGEETSPIELWLCFLLLALSLLLLPRLLSGALKTITEGMSPLGPLSPRALVIGLMALIVALQLIFIPQLLVTVFAGYGAVGEAWALRPVLKYGAATTALYGPLLGLFGPSTGVMIATNLVIAFGAIFLAGALARRLGSSPLSGLIALVLVGLIPALMRDRASESILVPMVFWVLASLIHLDAHLRSGCRRHALGAVVTAGLALHARPEVWVVLPMLWMAILALRGGSRPWFRLALGAFVLALPRLWSLVNYALHASQSGDVPGLADAELAGMVERFIELNALWWPSLFPPLALWCALAALLLPRDKRASVAWVLLAILSWQALSTLDLPPVSAPRIQAPAMLWTAVLAASFLGLLVDVHRLGRWLAPLLVLAMIYPPMSTRALLWQPTNAQRFDAWWQSAIEQVEPSERERCVVALDMSDPPRDSVIRLYPLYELAERSGRLEVYSISTFLEAPESVLDGHCEPLYLEGPQCWARFFGFDAPAPERAELLERCAEMSEGFTLRPIARAEVENAGNADFPFYGRSPTLRYGIYVIEGVKD